MTRKFYPVAIVLALLLVLVFTAYPFSAQAKNGRFDHIQDPVWYHVEISPESGNWNYPGYFILEADETVTISWLIKCTYGGCGRPDEPVTTYTLAAGERISVGWGHQCYAWQFDPIGRAGFIASAEPELCAQPTPTNTTIPPTETSTATPGGPTATATATTVGPTATFTATSVGPTVTATATVTPGGPTLTATATQGGPSATPTNTPGGPIDTATPTTPPITPTTPSPGDEDEPEPTEQVILPATGQGPPPSLFSSPLWPALAALLLLGLAGRMVWTAILQGESVQVQANLYPTLRQQARKALILILLSLLILSFMVLPSIIRQAGLDFGGPRSYNPQLPAVIQELPPNFMSAPVEQEAALEVQAVPQALDSQRSKYPVMAAAGEIGLEKWLDSSPVTRLVIPALEVDSNVSYTPFENQTWDLEDLGFDIAWLGNTSGPGLGSNTVLAGHITVLNQGRGPFFYLHKLETGDLVYVYTVGNLYTYSVREQAIYSANNPAAIDPTDQTQLTLLTCTGWDEKTMQYTDRRVVIADLVSQSPLPKDSW